MTVTKPDNGQQRRNDVVVFDATPLDPSPDPDSADANTWEPTFLEVAVLHEGQMTAWAVFGLDPGEGVWSTMVSGAGRQLAPRRDRRPAPPRLAVPSQRRRLSRRRRSDGVLPIHDRFSMRN